MVSKAIAELLRNASGALFALGVALLLTGIARWSPPAAYVVAGVIAMTIGAFPYVLKFTRKGHS